MKYLLSFISIVVPLLSMAGMVDSAALHRHVLSLTDTPGYRNYVDTARLNQAAAYIYHTLGAASKRLSTQPYTVRAGKPEYTNIIASFGPEAAPRIIVGAHYDVCGAQMGADDNASGVAALLELAQLLSKAADTSWKYRIDLVAYTLEEPPFFQTAHMGSAIHAQSLARDRIPVRGMVSLEMIGYYKDAKHTQHYPIGILRLFYGSRANYITVVHKLRKGPFVRSFQRQFKRAHLVKTKKFGAPRSLVGIDFSDHLNYWDQNWEALMITDTSFYRNANYHKSTDTPETLDYRRMAAVTEQVYRALMAQVH